MTRKRVHSLRSISAREAHAISEQREHAKAYQSRALTRLAMTQKLGVGRALAGDGENMINRVSW